MVSILPPEAYARELLFNLNINTLPTPVEDICAKLSIELIMTPEIKSEAIIVKKLDTSETKIIVKSNSSYDTRTRFSISHELGHFMIPSHLHKTYSCTMEDLHNYTPDKQAEKEANEFASELLMPHHHFEKDVKQNELSMANLVMLSEKYNTSLLATAIRFITSCDDLGTLVFSQAARIKWAISSKNFTGIIRDSGPLHDNSNAIEYFLDGQAINGTPQKVLSVAWLSDINFHADYLIEETISMPRLGCTLSIIKPVIDDYDEDLYDEFY